MVTIILGGFLLMSLFEVLIFLVLIKTKIILNKNDLKLKELLLKIIVGFVFGKVIYFILGNLTINIIDNSSLRVMSKIIFTVLSIFFVDFLSMYFFVKWKLKKYLYISLSSLAIIILLIFVFSFFYSFFHTPDNPYFVIKNSSSDTINIELEMDLNYKLDYKLNDSVLVSDLYYRNFSAICKTSEFYERIVESDNIEIQLGLTPNEYYKNDSTKLKKLLNGKLTLILPPDYMYLRSEQNGCEDSRDLPIEESFPNASKVSIFFKEKMLYSFDIKTFKDIMTNKEFAGEDESYILEITDKDLKTKK